MRKLISIFLCLSLLGASFAQAETFAPSNLKLPPSSMTSLSIFTSQALMSRLPWFSTLWRRFPSGDAQRAALIESTPIARFPASAESTSLPSEYVWVKSLKRALLIPDGVLTPDNVFTDSFLDWIQKHPRTFKNKVVREIGTGSGALAIALGRAGATVLAGDIWPPAVDAAQTNVAQENKTVAERISVEVCDGYQPLTSEVGDKKVDFVVANYPVHEGEVEISDGHSIAHYSGDDFKLNRDIIRGLPGALRRKGKGFVWAIRPRLAKNSQDLPFSEDMYLPFWTEARLNESVPAGWMAMRISPWRYWRRLYYRRIDADVALFNVFEIAAQPIWIRGLIKFVQWAELPRQTRPLHQRKILATLALGALLGLGNILASAQQPLEMNGDPAEIPIASQDHPQGRLSWDYYNSQNPQTLLEKDASHRRSRTFFFPVPQVSNPHQAQSRRERKVAAEFTQQLQKRKAGDWPTFIFFGRMDSFLFAATDLISFKDFDGELHYGVGIFVNTRRLEKNGEAGKPNSSKDIRSILDHEFGHVPKVWDHAMKTLRIADQIEEKLKTENRSSPSRRELEKVVSSGLLALDEIAALHQQNKTWLQQASEAIQKDYASNWKKAENKFHSAFAFILVEYFGDLFSAEHKGLKSWLTMIFTQNVEHAALLRISGSHLLLAAG
jgi:hypothetical protein